MIIRRRFRYLQQCNDWFEERDVKFLSSMYEHCQVLVSMPKHADQFGEDAQGNITHGDPVPKKGPSMPAASPTESGQALDFFSQPPIAMRQPLNYDTLKSMLKAMQSQEYDREELVLSLKRVMKGLEAWEREHPAPEYQPWPWQTHNK